MGRDRVRETTGEMDTKKKESFLPDKCLWLPIQAATQNARFIVRVPLIPNKKKGEAKPPRQTGLYALFSISINIPKRLLPNIWVNPGIFMQLTICKIRNGFANLEQQRAPHNVSVQ